MLLLILFIAIHALTNTNNIFSGVFNGLATFGVISLVDRAVNRVDDQGSQKQSLDSLTEKVVVSAKSKLAYLKRQVEIGTILMRQKHMRVRKCSLLLRMCPNLVQGTHMITYIITEDI